MFDISSLMALYQFNSEVADARRRVKAKLEATELKFSKEDLKLHTQRIAAELIKSGRQITDETVRETLERSMARMDQDAVVKERRIAIVLEVGDVMRRSVTDMREESADTLIALVAFALEKSGGDYSEPAVLAMTQKFRKSHARLFADDGLRAYLDSLPERD